MATFNQIRLFAHLIVGLFLASTVVLCVEPRSLSPEDARGVEPKNDGSGERGDAGAVPPPAQATDDSVGPAQPVASTCEIKTTEAAATATTAMSMQNIPLQNLRHAMTAATAGGDAGEAKTTTETSWTSSRLAAGGQGGHFPLRGTSAFTEECGWTERPLPDGNCTILIRPNPRLTEGIANWIASVVHGYISARQAGCTLMADYGPAVNVRSVLDPMLITAAAATEEEEDDVGDRRSAAGTGPDEGLYDWTVPPNFECRTEDRCFEGMHNFRSEHLSPKLDDVTSLAPLVNYRFATTVKVRSLETCHLCLFEDSAPELRRALPGFRLETGYACVHSNLFRLSPSAVRYEPRLFDEILPALHDDTNLVIGIYIRTGQTDAVIEWENRARRGEVSEKEGPPSVERDFTRQAGRMLRCVESVERRYLTGQLDAGRDRDAFSGVVWMLLTDSPKLKNWVASEYHNAPTGIRNVERRVLVTGARGVQTRPDRDPSNSDFAEAMIDWLLIGESDVVASNKLTFGNMGALRTARPLYDLGQEGYKCERKVLVHSRPKEKEAD